MESLIKRAFRLFVFFLPTQLAYHFWPDWALVFGIRSDYLSPTIYLTDIFAAGIIVFYLLKNKKTRTPKKDTKVWLVTGLFILLNIAFAKLPAVSFLRWVKLLEVYLVFLAARNLKALNFANDFLKPLALSSFFFSLIGIFQFIKGGTLGGPFYLLGERSFDLSTPGIALVELVGRNFLRAYSTFPHPNSFAGFLSVTLMLMLAQKKKLFKDGVTFLVYTFVATAAALTFSLGALVGLFLTYTFYVYFKKSPGKAIFFVGAASAFLLLVSLRLPAGNFSESIEKRLVLAEVAGKRFFEKPLFGIGLNNFVARGTRLLQPVHNVYILTLVETGIVGVGFFFWILFSLLKRASQSKLRGVYPALLLILFTGLFDHYSLTLQQNLLLFSLILGYSQRRG